MRGKDNILYPDMISGPTVTWCDKLFFWWNRIPFWIPAVSAVAIIFAAFIVRGERQINEVSETSMMVRTLLPEEEQLLVGMYHIRSLGADRGIRSSAVLSGVDGNYCVTVYSDYSPLNLEAELLSDGTLRCDGLGEGIITYKPSTGSINIVFTKEGTDICEFSK